MLDLPVRMWKKIKVNHTTGCWEWQGSLDRHGYGRSMIKSKRQLVHRLTNKTPDSLDTDHLCRNRKCCNPDHLESVTRKENIRRGDTGKYTASINIDNNHNKFKTKCKRGHSLSGDNLYINPKKERICRECVRISKRKYLAKPVSD